MMSWRQDASWTLRGFSCSVDLVGLAISMLMQQLFRIVLDETRAIRCTRWTCVFVGLLQQDYLSIVNAGTVSQHKFTAFTAHAMYLTRKKRLYIFTVYTVEFRILLHCILGVEHFKIWDIGTCICVDASSIYSQCITALSRLQPVCNSLEQVLAFRCRCH